ncbi:MAG: outer membrane protein assembly factor BamA, partial [Myxococcota bacterium]
ACQAPFRSLFLFWVVGSSTGGETMGSWSILAGFLLGCTGRVVPGRGTPALVASEAASRVLVAQASPCEPPNECAVRQIRFDNNGSAFQGTGDYSVRAAMEQGRSLRFTFIAPRQRRVFLDADVLRMDGWRIETWYAHRGHFDAKFLGWDVEVLSEGGGFLRPNRPPTVRLTGRIEEGAPTVLGSIEGTDGDAVIWEGWESLGKGARPLLAQLETSSELETGSRFSLSAVKSTEGAVIARMQEQSYARTTVRSAVEVWPEEQLATVRFIGDLGPDCTFGPVEINGDFGIPPELVLAEVSFEEGDAFRASILSKTRQKLFALGVFSVVNVTPILDSTVHPADVIPIRIDLTERKYRQLKLGGGLLLESGQQGAHISAELGHANLFNRLVRLTFANRIGYSIISDVSLDGLVDGDDTGDEEVVEITSQGVTGETSINLLIPRFPSERYQVELDLVFERGVEQAYQFDNPSVSPSISWKPKGPWRFKLAYQLEYLRYFNYTVDIKELLDPRFGLDFTNPYLLSSVSQSVIYDSRNDPVDVRSGTYAIMGLTEAGGPLGGQFSFIRISGDYRKYASLLDIAGLSIGGKSLRRRWNWRPLGAVAGRMAGGVIFPYGENASVPYAERLYLGGGSDVRGWASNHLGPYIIENCEAGLEATGRDTGSQVINACASENGAQAKSNENILPIGGTISGQLGVEYRRYFQDTYGLVLFLDSGMVWDDRESLRADWETLTTDWTGWLSRDTVLAPTVGIGGRYKSPVGPARLDLAFRLTDDGRFANEPRIRIHFALAEAF